MAPDLPLWAVQYLDILGLQKAAPSFSLLQKICTAHLSTFPFENISKLLQFRDREKNGYLIPPPQTFIDHHNNYDFGGTCFTLNSNLKHLLDALGYDVHFAMLSGVHMGLIVRLPEFYGERVYVDCGSAGPFFVPVRFETDPENVSRFGADEVHIRKQGSVGGTYVYSRYMNGVQSGEQWSFEVNERPPLESFFPVIEKASQPGTTFMSMLRCQIWQLDMGRSASLSNNVFSIRYADGTTKKTVLHTPEEIEQVIADEFHLEKLPIREALCVLESLGVDIFAKAER